MAVCDDAFTNNGPARISFDVNFRSTEEDQEAYWYNGKGASCLCHFLAAFQFPRALISVSVVFYLSKKSVSFRRPQKLIF
jgi:hypothetical protein